MINRRALFGFGAGAAAAAVGIKAGESSAPLANGGLVYSQGVSLVGEIGGEYLVSANIGLAMPSLMLPSEARQMERLEPLVLPPSFVNNPIAVEVEVANASGYDLVASENAPLHDLNTPD